MLSRYKVRRLGKLIGDQEDQHEPCMQEMTRQA